MMTDLTNLTVAQIRDGHRAGDFSAVEVAEAFNANVAAAKALNAFIVETPEQALGAAKQADADRAAGTLKPLSGVPIGMKDLFATKGVQTTAALKRSATSRAVKSPLATPSRISLTPKEVRSVTSKLRSC